MRNIITGLDIGASKICATIAEIKEKNGPLDILGTGVSRSKGLWRGAVSNLTNLTDSIAAAVSAAEEKAKLKTRTFIRAHNIITNVGGSSVKAGTYEGGLFLSHIPRVVTRRDINKVVGIARDLSVSLTEDPIHLVPLGYTLDGQEGIENPLGLYGVKLKVRLYVISCATNLVRNIARAVNNSGYEINQTVYTGMANSSNLSEEEKSDGVVLINIGSHVIELAVFFKGKIRYKSSLNMGGSDLTEQISTQFKIPERVAEDLKLRYGTIYEQDLNIDERLNVDVDRRQVSIDRSSMNYLIYSKVKEIFGLIKKELESSGLQKSLPAGIVMSGSPLLMSGVIETAEKEFSMPVRMGTSNPAHDTSMGLVKYGLEEFARRRSGIFKKESFMEKAVYRIKEIFTDYF